MRPPRSALTPVSWDDLRSGKDKGTNLPVTLRFSVELEMPGPEAAGRARGVSCDTLEEPLSSADS